MRIRTITPGFWEDEAIGALPRDARLLYIATWNIADDEGLLRWTPEYLKASAFIYDDDIDVAALMNLLEVGGQVLPYKAGRMDQRLGWIVMFHRHQRVNRPQPSKLPPPSIQNPAVRMAYAARGGWECEWCGEAIEPGGPEMYEGGKVVQTGLSLDHILPRMYGGSDYPSNIRICHRGCTASPEAPHPNVAVNGSVNVSGPQSLLEGKGNRKGRGKGSITYPLIFEVFWEAYPLKKAKGAALRAWDKAITRATPEEIIAGAQRYRDDPQRKPQYTKYAEGWLNADRWTDEATPAPSNGQDPRATVIRLAKEMGEA